MDLEFHPYPKTHRWNRDIFVTEKIDGTNAGIIILDDGTVYAQSRRRVITPESDNYGFAAWVHENEDVLRETLGPGTHYGEWWGKGINRGYGKPARRFSLFNVDRYTIDSDMAFRIAESGIALEVVPLLYTGPMSQLAIDNSVSCLRLGGSWAAPGWMRPEGIVIYHTHSNTLYKVTLENDTQHKWQVAKRPPYAV